MSARFPRLSERRGGPRKVVLPKAVATPAPVARKPVKIKIPKPTFKPVEVVEDQTPVALEQEQVGSRRDVEAQSSEGAEYFNWPVHGITCFHCGEHFDRVKDARLHFGATPDEQPGCLLKLNDQDKGLLALVRFQYAELDRYRQEDQPIMREIYALGAKHARELIAAEQRGYDKGLADGRAEQGSQAKAGDEAVVGARAEATVEPVSRPAAGRSAAATSEQMDVTAGETAPAPIARSAPSAPLREPVTARLPEGGKLDLNKVPSSMEQQARPAGLAPKAAAPVVDRGDMVPCRCGAKGLTGYGMVPRWFGKDCIETGCPLKDAA